jgi:hypothetical protein
MSDTPRTPQAMQPLTIINQHKKIETETTDKPNTPASGLHEQNCCASSLTRYKWRVGGTLDLYDSGDIYPDTQGSWVRWDDVMELHEENRQLERELAEARKQRDTLAEALKLIATWHSYDELHDEVIECEKNDFAFGYDEAIKISREALQSLREDQNEL